MVSGSTAEIPLLSGWYSKIPIASIYCGEPGPTAAVSWTKKYFADV